MEVAMDSSTNIDGKSRLGQVRELHNQGRKVDEEWITLEALAEKYHISAATLSRAETGKSEPSVSVLKAYSEEFSVTLEYLLGISENEDMKTTAVVRELGLTDTTATTLKKILVSSSKESDLSAAVNAFLGNGEYTEVFFLNLLNYLKNDDDRRLSNNLFLFLEDYIKEVVKPQLKSVLEKSQATDEYIASIPDEVKYAETADTPDN